MNKPLVYLAGSITGLTFREASEWRERARLMLEDVADVADPMRGKQSIANNPDPLDCQYPGKGKLLEPKAIFHRDRNDVGRSDALLVNLSQIDKPSIGTAFELAWSFELRIPAIVIIRPEQARHPFIVGSATVMVENLEEGVRVVRSFLGFE